MKSEHDPITDDELVLRLVWRDHYRAGDPLTIKPMAFKPRRDEVTGISVFRMECLSTPSQALQALPDPEKRAQYIIVALPIALLITLGLSVTTDRIESVPGHALLRELNFIAYSQNKAIWLPKTEQLAKLATERIVFVPQA